MACLEEGVISVCFLLGDESPRYNLQGCPVWRGAYPSVVVFIGTKHRVQSPLERWLSMISTNGPKMESRPYEFLLHSPVLMLLTHIMSVIHRDILHPGFPTANLGE